MSFIWDEPKSLATLDRLIKFVQIKYILKSIQFFKKKRKMERARNRPNIPKKPKTEKTL